MFNPAQIKTFKNEVNHLFDNRYNWDISGENWEQVYSTVMDAHWTPGRDNRPHGDVGLKVSCKTTKADQARFVITRSLRVDKYITDIQAPSPDALGDIVADCYNSFLINYAWDRYAILLRRESNTDFLFWEADVERLDKDQIEWRDTGNAIDANRNLAGYDRITGNKLCAWNSGGKQFWLVFEPPKNSQNILLN